MVTFIYRQLTEECDLLFGRWMAYLPVKPLKLNANAMWHTDNLHGSEHFSEFS